MSALIKQYCICDGENIIECFNSENTAKISLKIITKHNNEFEKCIIKELEVDRSLHYQTFAEFGSGTSRKEKNIIDYNRKAFEDSLKQSMKELSETLETIKYYEEREKNELDYYPHDYDDGYDNDDEYDNDF